MKKLHIIRLPDYSIPPIVSGGTKEYIGTKEDIKKVVPNHDDKNMDESVILAEATYYLFDTEHIFINTYGFDHNIKADKIKASIIHTFDGEKYMRCVKAKMNNLQIGVNGQDYYKPYSFMGPPNILYIENDWICSNLYAVEQIFKNYQACLADINHISPITFDCFFSDIFGDG